ncbi:aminopeptidase [Natrialba taiwanensis]|uniref:Putative leucyl aminopeptidase n=1 Tax=Natrialba taiwanensis DSM 12281 TaxID=1230458 RepID=L9ZT13_9EURY|nr:aminopeptidase [Natrialba taiwanensis]ELY88328.1 putative leucyl aminopeptidase [Natrialba taiwanensis DSM 12281]
MDERIREHAAVLVEWSGSIKAGNDVVIAVGEGAHELGVAVAEKLGAVGAHPVTTYVSDEIERAYLRAHDCDFDETPAHELALYEETDSVLLLVGSRNTATFADVPQEVRHAWPTEAVREAWLATDWVKTVHPTRAHAQQAGMTYEAYQDFVYDAVLRDWGAFADEMAELKTLLDAGSEVRIVKGMDDTDITMSIEGRKAVIADGSGNLPSGEVYTVPSDTTGEVYFDVPMTVQGRRVQGVRLRFEDGEVVDHAAETGETALGELLETDAGARRLGELGVGMNRGIDRFTDNILFDEKMDGTVHLAVGSAYNECLPDGEKGNQSAIHTDLITDMTREETRLEVDGEVIQCNGTFRWEEGFDG